MNKSIVVINGSGGVGKDTFVEYCQEFTGVRNISSVDKVKEAAKVLVNWNGDKDEKSRRLLSDLKKLSIDYNDYPTKYIEEQAKEYMKDKNQGLMFVHIREKEEIQKIKELLNAKTLLITSNRVEKILTNYSDANVEDYNYDYNIKNDGTLEELREQAKLFVKELTSK